MIVTIAKFGLYPKEDPSGYAVGFNITTDNGRSFYRDILVTLEEAQDKNDEEIVAVAWEKLEGGINQETERLMSKSTLLGREWNPVRIALRDEGEESGDLGETENICAVCGNSIEECTCGVSGKS